MDMDDENKRKWEVESENVALEIAGAIAEGSEYLIDNSGASRRCYRLYKAIYKALRAYEIRKKVAKSLAAFFANAAMEEVCKRTGLVTFSPPIVIETPANVPVVRKESDNEI